MNKEIVLTTEEKEEIKWLIDDISEELSMLEVQREEYAELEEMAGDSSSQEWGIDDDLSSTEQSITSLNDSIISNLNEIYEILKEYGIEDEDAYLKKHGLLSESLDERLGDAL